MRRVVLSLALVLFTFPALAAVELLVAAVDTSTYLKGDIVVAKQSPAVWGGKEGPPDFIRVTITDADLAEVQPYLEVWINVIQGESLGVVGDKRRVRVFVDPAVVGKVLDAKAFRSDLKDFFVNVWGAEIVTGTDTSTEATLDFPLSVSLQDVKADLENKFDERIFERAYYFDPADVDTVLGLGGTINRTKAQVGSQILDRRD